MVHWHYFLALEEDLARLSRFIEFDPRNDKTFSLELAHLYLTTCSEVDVVLKQLAVRYTTLPARSNISHYFSPLNANLPSLLSYEITLARNGRSFKPWITWTAAASPTWWAEHNDVKHQRHTHFDKATVENCLNAMSALFILVIHLHSAEASSGNLIGVPRLLHVAEKHFGGHAFGDGGTTIPIYKV